MTNLAEHKLGELLVGAYYKTLDAVIADGRNNGVAHNLYPEFKGALGSYVAEMVKAQHGMDADVNAKRIALDNLVQAYELDGPTGRAYPSGMATKFVIAFNEKLHEVLGIEMPKMGIAG